jgi:riboflavin synthase
MFTGIIERTGKVVSVSTHRAGGTSGMNAITQVIIDPEKGFETKLGDSVSVNGCCLTVTSNKMNLLSFDVSRETLDKTNLADLREGQDINLERAMALGARLGGHLVSGHIDCCGIIERIEKNSDGWIVEVSIPRDFGRYLIAKGSICIDGVSLTINTLKDVADRSVVGLTLIPTTISLTCFRHATKGAEVNIEVDLIGKYIERLTTARNLP